MFHGTPAVSAVGNWNGYQPRISTSGIAGFFLSVFIVLGIVWLFVLAFVAVVWGLIEAVWNGLPLT